MNAARPPPRPVHKRRAAALWGAALLGASAALATILLRDPLRSADGLEPAETDTSPLVQSSEAGGHAAGARGLDDLADPSARLPWDLDLGDTPSASGSRPSSDRTLTVRVLDAASRRPAPAVWPGTEVVVRAAAPDWESLTFQERAVFRDVNDWEVLTARWGQRYSCDANGEVSLPLPARALLLAARAGSAYAEGFASPRSEGPVELLLEPDLRVQVRVVGPSGAPVIGIRAQLREAAARPDQPPAVSAVTIAPSGIATFAHLQNVARQQGRRALAAATVVAAIAAPGVHAVSAPFEWRAPPPDPVTITIPDTGTVEVAVVEQGRVPADRVLNAAVGERGEQPLRSWIPVDPATGTARFPCVGLGTRLLVGLYAGDVSLPEREVAGPVQPAEVVRVVFDLARELPSLAARALDAARSPLAGKDLAITVRTDRDRSEKRCKADADGRVSVLLDPSWIGSTLLDVSLGTRGSGELLSARLAQRRTLVAGPNDLGAVVLEPPPLIVAGTVVDTDGEPVSARCEVLFGARGGDPAKASWFKLRPPDVVARNADACRFEVRGKVPPGELRLSVQHDEFLELEPIAFARGQDDLRVVLARGGRLAARVLCDTDGEPPRVRLVLRAAGALEAADLLPNEAVRSASGLEHRWRGLAPGSYVLSALVRPDPEPVLVLRDLVVPAGGACRDPRLEAIDLRGRLRRIEVAVVGPDGEPVAEGNVRIVSGGSSLPGSGVPLASGKATLPVHRPEVDILVKATGYRPKSLTGVGADTKVTLERGQNVRVALTGLSDATGKGVDCWLTYDGQPDHDPSADFDFRIPDLVGRRSVSAGAGQRDPATGEYAFSIGETGSYIVHARTAPEPGRKAGPDLPLGKVLVVAQDSPQRFSIAVPARVAAMLSGVR